MRPINAKDPDRLIRFFSHWSRWSWSKGRSLPMEFIAFGFKSYLDGRAFLHVCFFNFEWIFRMKGRS